jgi:hypothetical protein
MSWQRQAALGFIFVSVLLLALGGDMIALRLMGLALAVVLPMLFYGYWRYVEPRE